MHLDCLKTRFHVLFRCPTCKQGTRDYTIEASVGLDMIVSFVVGVLFGVIYAYTL